VTTVLIIITVLYLYFFRTFRCYIRVPSATDTRPWPGQRFFFFGVYGLLIYFFFCGTGTKATATLTADMGRLGWGSGNTRPTAGLRVRMISSLHDRVPFSWLFPCAFPHYPCSSPNDITHLCVVCAGDRHSGQGFIGER
jgi:hypothetical protein